MERHLKAGMQTFLFMERSSLFWERGGSPRGQFDEWNRWKMYQLFAFNGNGLLPRKY
jgi:hypothetical protein